MSNVRATLCFKFLAVSSSAFSFKTTSSRHCLDKSPLIRVNSGFNIHNFLAIENISNQTTFQKPGGRGKGGVYAKKIIHTVK